MGPLSSCLRGKDTDQDDDASNNDSNNGSNNESNDSPDAVSPPLTPDAIDLAQHIRSAIGKVCGGWPQDLCLPSANPPMLRKGVVNYILVYRGSFNPPHIGHKALLAHALFRSSYENMVAALIVPKNDEQLDLKMAETDKSEISAIVLTRSQRAQLWQDDATMTWAWAHGYDEHHFSQVRQVMTNLLAYDGIEVEFVYIAGGERALGHAEDEVARFEKGEKTQLDNLIFSNPMRTVDVSKENGYLRKVDGYGVWEPSPEGDKELIEIIMNGTLRASYVLELL